MICLICSGLRIGVVSEEVAPSCSAVVAIVFGCVLPCFSLSSDPLGDRGSGVVGLRALSSVKALSSPSAGNERSRFCARGSISFFVVGLHFVCLLGATG